jgi:hypothetical protein
VGRESSSSRRAAAGGGIEILADGRVASGGGKAAADGIELRIERREGGVWRREGMHLEVERAASDDRMVVAGGIEIRVVEGRAVADGMPARCEGRRRWEGRREGGRRRAGERECGACVGSRGRRRQVGGRRCRRGGGWAALALEGGTGGLGTMGTEESRG